MEKKAESSEAKRFSLARISTAADIFFSPCGGTLFRRKGFLCAFVMMQPLKNCEKL
ncbi:MAG TPA: hypothetical protein H9708_07515 [Candidatus Borkfalkia stercoripullorum]|nr:hypothetical protein [Candidatus Borkfalkia stercoripullorum]